MNVAVAVSRRINHERYTLAEELAKKLSLPLLRDITIKEIWQQGQYQALLLIENTKLKMITPNAQLFFHPSMSALRVDKLTEGGADHLVDAMQLTCGMSVLDATLGLATDALVCATVVGSSGYVVGLEASPWLSLIVRLGLEEYKDKRSELTQAARHIKVVNTDNLEYLIAQADNSFDIVYFDPMFAHPVVASSNMQPLREFACYRPLDHKAIEEAMRVAKRRVVIKENRHNELLKKLPLTKIAGGKYSKICYGIIEV